MATTRHRRLRAPAWIAALVVSAWDVGAAPCAAEDFTDEVLNASGARSGLCVALGGEVGPLAKLAREHGILVQALTGEADTIDAARTFFHAQGIYGQVSVEHAAAYSRLPYANHTVNLLIADDVSRLVEDGLTPGELLRVLCPGGVALVGGGDDRVVPKEFDAALRDSKNVSSAGATDSGRWLKIVKARPAGMDEWTHRRHRADGNRVSADTLLEPPTGLRWIAPPKLSDRSFRSMLVTRERLYYIVRDLHAPVQYLTARDAYNGLLLWDREIRLRPQSEREVLMGENRWPLVAGDGRVFALVENRIVAIDGRSGNIDSRYNTSDAELAAGDELLYIDGQLIVATANRLFAFNAKTAEPAWSRAARRGDVAAGDGKVFFTELDADAAEFHAVCLDLDTGREMWRKPVKDLKAMRIDRRGNRAENKVLVIYQDGYVVLGGTSTSGPLTAIVTLSAKDGARLARYETKARRIDHICFRDGLVWVPPSLGIDPKTGRVQRTLPGGGGWGAFFSSTCQPPVFTARLALSPKPSVRAYNYKTGRVRYSSMTVGTCNIGMFPANGLLYNSSQIACVCSTSTVHGLTALEASNTAEKDFIPPLERGRGGGGRDSEVPADGDWPTFRHDPQRSGIADTEVDPDFALLWEAAVARNSSRRPQPAGHDDDRRPQERVSAPVIAGGRVLVAEIDAHRVVALNAATGAKLWTFTAGGRIDSPPTIHGKLCLFGCRDGWLYCLQCGDGKLAWRLRLAPGPQRIIAYGQLESPWPVHGSVLVRDNLVYATAGRSSAAEGGIRAYAIEPSSGRVAWSQVLDRARVGPLVDDVLVAGNESLFLRHVRIDPTTGQTQHASRLSGIKGRGEVRVPRDPERGPPRPRYLYSGWFTSLVDGSWRYAVRSYAKGNHRRTYDGSALGQLIVFDGRRTWGFRTGYWSGDRRYDQPSRRPLLFAATHIAPTKETDNAPAYVPQDDWTVELSDGAWVEAMTKSGDTLFVAGPVDHTRRREQGGFLWAVSSSDGRKQHEMALPSPPALDGLAAANRRLYLTTADGRVMCFGGSNATPDPR